MTKCCGSSGLVYVGILFCVFGSVHWCCGVVGSIEGGPKDSTAPVFVRSYPLENATSVRLRPAKVYLGFDEFVQITDPKKVEINPVSKTPPRIEADLRNVVVTFDTSFRTDITYFLDFKNTIGDLNENNKIQSLTFVFSTGEHIDSFSISGRIFDAKTAKPDPNSYAALYPAKGFSDSDVANKYPLYIAQADSTGAFLFRYLRADNYYLFALNDKDKNRKYSSPTEAFGFYDSIVRPSGTPVKPFMLFTSARVGAPRVLPSPSKRIKGKKVIRYAHNARDGVLNYNQKLKVLFYDSIVNIDTSAIQIKDTTTLRDTARYTNKYIDSMRFVSGKDTSILTCFLTAPFGNMYALILPPAFVRDSQYTLEKPDTLALRVLAKKDYRKTTLVCGACAQVHNPTIVVMHKQDTVQTLGFHDSKVGS